MGRNFNLFKNFELIFNFALDVLILQVLKTVLAVSSDVAWNRANHLHVWVDHFMAAKQTLDGNYIIVLQTNQIYEINAEWHK